MLVLVFGAIGFVTVIYAVPFVLARIAPIVAQRRELHQIHKAAVPRLGGIALAIGFVLVCAATFAVDSMHSGHPRLVLALTSLAMFGLGLWDDISPLGAKKKLVGQILIASAAFYFGLQVETFKNPLTGELYSLGLWSAVATVFWLVALTNLINLVDGIDGLAGGIALMLMCLLAYVGFQGQVFSLCIAVGMAGALIAFLYFNFPPAKIYLGDGGAYFLGYLIAGLAIQNSNKGTIAAALIAPIFALALPILDVSLSIFRRGLQGLPIFRPDRRHIHHRLLSAGWSRRRAVLTLYAISLFFLVLAFVAFWSDGRLTAILVGCSFVVLLVVVPSLGLIKNWLTVGATFGNSLEMRKEIQYALLLRNWLQMEADRCDSLLSLWHDFTFAANKLGFAEATLTLRNVNCTWSCERSDGPLRSVRHEMQITGEMVVLHLTAPKTMEEKAFYLLSELAAETWLHSAVRWTRRSKMSFELPHNTDATPAEERRSVQAPASGFLSA